MYRQVHLPLLSPVPLPGGFNLPPPPFAEQWNSGFANLGASDFPLMQSAFPNLFVSINIPVFADPVLFGPQPLQLVQHFQQPLPTYLSSDSGAMTQESEENYSSILTFDKSCQTDGSGIRGKRGRRRADRSRGQMCTFCRNLGTPKEVYKSHNLHEIQKVRIVQCPALLEYVCPTCQELGHTRRYCPQREQRFHIGNVEVGAHNDDQNGEGEFETDHLH